VSQLAVTVIGHDRPGIIADVTGVLAELGSNLEDCSMTLLRGHFAMTLVLSTGAAATDVQEALARVTADRGLLVSVAEVPPEPEHEPAGGTYVLTVHGADRPGIVSAVTRVVADAGGNVTDLATRLAGHLYVLVADVELPASVDTGALSAHLTGISQELGVGATLRPAESDVL
jgi:glycine cleavage system transcriptional repressor